MKSTKILWALLLGALLATTANAAQADKDKGKKNANGITLTEIGRYSAGAGGTRAEIAAYDPATNRLFAINLAQSQIDVLDISTPHLPTALASIPLAAGFCQTASPFTTALSPSPSKPFRKLALARFNFSIPMGYF